MSVEFRSWGDAGALESASAGSLLWALGEDTGAAQLVSSVYHKLNPAAAVAAAAAVAVQRCIRGHQQDVRSLVNKYRPFDSEDAKKDPYRRFPDSETRLFYNQFLPVPRVIRLEDVRCHFAALICIPPGLDMQCIVACSG